jgi:TolB-like protein
MTRRPLRFSIPAVLVTCSLAALSAPAVAQSPAVAEQAAAHAAVATMVPVAILPFQDRGGEAGQRAVVPGGPPTGDAAKVTDLLFAELVAEPALVLIEREDIRKLLDEQELSLTGLANPAEATRVGQLTGAKMLVTGSIVRADNSLYLVAKIIGTETSRVLGASVKGTARDDLGKLTDGLAAEIVKVVTERGSELLPKVVTREDRLANLKKALPAGDRPPVLVEIAERHLAPAVAIAAAGGAAAIDPAAETEVTLFAKEGGFEVIDAREGKRSNAAVLLQGEAFSEPAGRHGNLLSAKARLELKAVDQATGQVIAIDRQTTVATDLSENIAAKTALQEAAAAVAERLLPKVAGLKFVEAGK